MSFETRDHMAEQTSEKNEWILRFDECARRFLAQLQCFAQR